MSQSELVQIDSQANRRRLTAEARTFSRAPERIVHIGVGAFHRAHQVAYTAAAVDRDDWGIVGYTGRSKAMAATLGGQDCLYGLVERGPLTDRIEILENLVRMEAASNIADLMRTLSQPHTSLVTLTITEAGYKLSEGALDRDDPQNLIDLTNLAHQRGAVSGGSPPLQTVVGRLTLGLDIRRRSRGGPIALVPCDNLPDNGSLLRSAVLEFAHELGAESRDWIEDQVSFVSTSVDRITPRTDPSLSNEVAEATGFVDDAPVVTEPFRDWILSGDFPAGRPAWESAGADVVDDLAPYESRKLWMLNGAHTLLACLGQLLGSDTVSEAVAIPLVERAVRAYWAEVSSHLPESLEPDIYGDALLLRFGNSRIEHRLAQIAEDALGKLRIRVVPVALLELEAGRTGAACAFAIASWIRAVRQGVRSRDSADADIDRASDSVSPDMTLLALVDARLAGEASFRAEISEVLRVLDE